MNGRGEGSPVVFDTDELPKLYTTGRGKLESQSSRPREQVECSTMCKQTAHQRLRNKRGRRATFHALPFWAYTEFGDARASATLPDRSNFPWLQVWEDCLAPTCD